MAAEAFDFAAPEPPEESVGVVPFPVLDDDALQGLPGRIVKAVLRYTEASPAPILAQLLSWFGAIAGRGTFRYVGQSEHPPTLHPLVIGRTSDGAKGTSLGVVSALFRAAAAVPAEGLDDRLPLTRISGLSTGEGLIELVRDGDGEKDLGVLDKRLLITEEEFVGVMARMDRQGNSLPQVLRVAWDGERLQTVTRASPQVATGAHVVLIAHATPREFKAKLSDGLLSGGSINRMLLIASRRRILLEDGNIPDAVLDDLGVKLARAIAHPRAPGRFELTPEAAALWTASHSDLARARSDGPVAEVLTRSRAQVHRVALVYALMDRAPAVDVEHLKAALALWRYVEDSAAWLFGTSSADDGEVARLVAWIAEAGEAGRTRTEIANVFYGKNRKAAEIRPVLAALVQDGRLKEVREETGGAPRFRYFA